MSTDIKTIKGLKYKGEGIEKTSLNLTRFWGGAKRKRTLQLTINNPEGYIQLSRNEVLKLAKTLLNSFDDNIYPSE